MPAVAITDSGNLFGALEFATTCSDAGVQPIIGCEIALERGDAATAGSRLGPRPQRNRTGSCCWCRTRPAIAICCGWSAAPISTASAERADDRRWRPGRRQRGLICLAGGPGSGRAAARRRPGRGRRGRADASSRRLFPAGSMSS